MQRLSSAAVSLLTSRGLRRSTVAKAPTDDGLWVCLEEGSAQLWSCVECSRLHAVSLGARCCEACGTPRLVDESKPTDGKDNELTSIVVVQNLKNDDYNVPFFCSVDSLVEVYCDNNRWIRARVMQRRGSSATIRFEQKGIAATWEKLDFPEDDDKVRCGKAEEDARCRGDTYSTFAPDSDDEDQLSEAESFDSWYTEREEDDMEWSDEEGAGVEGGGVVDEKATSVSNVDVDAVESAAGLDNAYNEYDGDDESSSEDEGARVLTRSENEIDYLKYSPRSDASTHSGEASLPDDSDRCRSDDELQ